jgi:hypothetical protein
MLMANRSKAFLASSIPELNVDISVVNIKRSAAYFHTYCWKVLIKSLFFEYGGGLVPVEEAGLTCGHVADEDDFYDTLHR